MLETKSAIWFFGVLVGDKHDVNMPPPPPPLLPEDLAKQNPHTVENKPPIGNEAQEEMSEDLLGFVPPLPPDSEPFSQPPLPIDTPPDWKLTKTYAYSLMLSIDILQRNNFVRAKTQ